uniref:Ovule protein n=1 Tax=Mesocestoides corti TaxID=53468 RepID=A0A5K3FZ94_MESCO
HRQGEIYSTRPPHTTRLVLIFHSPYVEINQTQFTTATTTTTTTTKLVVTVIM